MRLLMVTFLLVLMVGCTGHYWHHPSFNSEDFYRDKSYCTVVAQSATTVVYRQRTRFESLFDNCMGSKGYRLMNANDSCDLGNATACAAIEKWK